MSAGGQAVALLMASPQAKGLFHKAIAQSCDTYFYAISDLIGWRLAVRAVSAPTIR